MCMATGTIHRQCLCHMLGGEACMGMTMLFSDLRQNKPVHSGTQGTEGADMKG